MKIESPIIGKIVHATEPFTGKNNSQVQEILIEHQKGNATRGPETFPVKLFNEQIPELNLKNAIGKAAKVYCFLNVRDLGFGKIQVWLALDKIEFMP